MTISGEHSTAADWRTRSRFLFRTETGTLDAPTWRFHAGWLVALSIVLTAGWFVLKPYAHRSLATSAFIAPMTIAAYTYLIVYSFALILIAISFVMLTMKRLRERDYPVGLAGLVPALVFFAASLHFLRAQTPDVIAIGYVVALDVALAAAVGWTVVALGFTRGRVPS